MKYSLLILFLLIGLRVFPQYRWIENSYGEALGGAISCETGFNSVGGNPAGAAMSPLGFALSYSTRYSMKELSQKSFRGAVPVSRGAFFSGFDYYGFNLFNQTRVMGGYSMRLSKSVCAGVGINYHNIHIDDSPDNFNTVSGDIGIIVSTEKGFSFSSSISNLSNSQGMDNSTIVPVRMVAGTRYTFKDGHSMSVDIEKNSIQSELVVHAGIVARLRKCFTAMGGIGSHPLSVGAGFEFLFHNLTFGFAFRKNMYLGWIESVTLGWRMPADNDSKNN